MWSAVASPVFGGAVVVILLAVALRGDRRILLLVMIAGAAVVVGLAHDRRVDALTTAALPSGRVEIVATARTDPTAGPRSVVVIVPDRIVGDGSWQAWPGPPLLLADPPPTLAAGEPVAVTGVVEPGVVTFRGRSLAGRIDGRSTRLGSAPNPLLRLGNALRRAVLGHLQAVQDRPSGALVAGFLIGDTSRLPDRDARALRRAGLSHFVAVSGSNVALFLVAWWLVGGPLGLGPRRRAVLGIVGIVVFAVVTRWEPSVVRASVMAGLVLVGRIAGRPITPWTALGGAAALSLLVAPGLAGDVGFSLSVAATAGIICGVPVWAGRRPAWAWTILGATVSAQVAVAPLLLVWFGSVPLLAPLANLLAAPLVSLATALGGVGAVFGVGWLIEVGAAVAAIVLAIARTAADLPQMGPIPTIGFGLVVAAAVRARWMRPLIAAGVAIAVVLAVAPGRVPSQPMVHFLDVGQGDATLFMGPRGEVILVDGGPDPMVLERHLRDFGVERIDLLIVTHRHADHATGLVGITDAASVGVVWHAPQEGEGGAFDELLAEARDAGTIVEAPSPGDRLRVGSFVVDVLAPARRYAGPNDGSVAVLVTGDRGGTVFMSGDIEVHAQRDLGPLPADVLKVPHQGAATSDLDWLSASAPRVAVISVGPNDYGHPSAEVVDALEAAGAIVLRTDRDGTVSLPLADALARALASRR